MPTTAQLAPPTPAQHHRFHFLDALRGLAALCVIVSHIPHYLHSRYNSGAMAVDFFFCLSGFVVAFSYERRLCDDMSAGTFAKARIMRLYPIYLLALLLGVALFLRSEEPWLHVPAGSLSLLIVWQLFILPNCLVKSLPTLFPFDGPAWSLFYELVVSGVYCLLVRTKLAKTAVLSVLCFAGFLGLCMNGDLLLGGLNTTEHLGIAVSRSVFSFFMGVLVLRLFRRAPRGQVPPRLHLPLTAACIFAILFVCESPWGVMLHHRAHLVADVLIFPFVVYAGAHVKVSGRWIGFSSLIGDVSFPVYLLHPCLIWPLYRPRVTRYILAHPSTSHPAAAFVIVGSLAFSYLAHRLYELPVRRWLRQKFGAGFKQPRSAIMASPATGGPSAGS